MNIVAGRTTGTMEVTQSVQRWVLNSNGRRLKVGVLSGDPRFLGVHQGPGQRPLHPKRRIPRPQTWRYVVSMCSALAAGWCTSCLTLFLGCDSICVLTSFFPERSFSLSLQAMLAGSAPRVVAAATHQASLQVEKSW